MTENSERGRSEPGGVAVVVVAAGSGTRLGRNSPKALVPVAGIPMLTRALKGVRAALPDAHIIAVLPEDCPELWAVGEAFRGESHADGTGLVVLTPGGATRTESVRAGLDAVAPGITRVLVHDAARCLTPPSVFDAVVSALGAGASAVIPALPVVDTIKEASACADPMIATETVASTPSRAALRAVQTPQGFDRAALVEAHELARQWAGERAEAVTDDALLMELAGHTVHLVPGSELSLKITTELDLILAEALISRDTRTKSTSGGDA